MDRAHGYVAATASGAELMGLLHEPLPGIEVEIDEFCNIGSFNIDLALSFDLATRIEKHLARQDVSGVVVTHGTDTMEESAFLADLIVDSEKPIVFTGAQRNADEPDSDGPRNLADAIRIAASELQGLGATFLRSVVDAFPYRIHTVLTDKGISFAQARAHASGAMPSSGSATSTRSSTGSPSLSSLDQRSGGADEPHDQGRDRQGLS
jgi:L-asparaginase/Glu-tRNA(Gln) amidotransferase subunit D